MLAFQVFNAPLQFRYPSKILCICQNLLYRKSGSLKISKINGRLKIEIAITSERNKHFTWFFLTLQDRVFGL